MKLFWKCALIRALRTFAQAAIATISTTAVVLEDVRWLMVLSSAGLAALLSILNSIVTGLPEAEIPQTHPPEANEEEKA